MNKLIALMDSGVNRGTRALAKRLSRRGFLARLGSVLVGVGAFPLLPVAREAAAANDIPELGDPQSCDYWRYCGFHGSLCSCCGGTLTHEWVLIQAVRFLLEHEPNTEILRSFDLQDINRYYPEFEDEMRRRLSQ